MSEQVSDTLLKMMDEMVELEETISKVKGAIFVRNNEKIINEKVTYLYNLLQLEAKNYSQKQENFFDTTNLMISHYKQKLNMIYDEFYCQYVNIQNEIQDARINQNVTMINYQKIINDIEKNKISKEEAESIKERLKEKNKMYESIIEKCNSKFETCKIDFESKINEVFLIESNLQTIEQKGFFARIKNKILNFFSGSEKYNEILNKYNRKIDSIDIRGIVDDIRDETVIFIQNILEMRGIYELEDEKAI